MGEVYSLHGEGNAYEIVISNGFAALEILNDGEDLNRTWENIEKNI